MPTNIKILSPSEINSFDLPPALNTSHRKELFRPTKGAADVIESFRTPINKITFVLQFGYFKATNKFFKPEDFRKNEIDFVCTDFKVLPESVAFDKFDPSTLKRHQRIILDLLGSTPFTEQSKQLLMQEALTLCSCQIKPIVIFDELVDFLKDKKIEVPGYYVLANIITTALNEYEKSLLASLNQVMPQGDKRFLDSLLKGSDANLKLLSYKLTDLKKASQSLLPMGIKENVKGLLYFKELFEKLERMTSLLKLNIQTTQYYAGLVIKSQTFQMIRREDNKYLLLICFIIHQYFTLNDYLIDSLIQASQSARNTADKKFEQQYYLKREQRQKAMKKAFEKTKGHLLTSDQTLKNILDILSNDELSTEQRVEEAKSVAIKHFATNSPAIKDDLTKMESELTQFEDEDYYDILESTSIKLQNRVSEIIKHICFDHESSNKRILKAIDYYKEKDGTIGQDAPVDFLKQEDKDALFDDHKKIRVSLYKALLFQEIAKAIKSGALNLRYSYKYQSFDNYLIPQKEWDENKESIMSRAGLTKFKDFNIVKNGLDITIKSKFELINKNIKERKNTFVKFGPFNKMILTTPPLKEKEQLGFQVADLFPQDRDISLFEILSTVNKIAPFLDCLGHWKTKMHWGNPDDKTFFAVIIGLGCNLGLRKMARISNDIKLTTLENTATWRLSEENITNANNKILGVINKLSLPHVYQRDPEIIHTSSDGQKFGVNVDSLNARHSFKFFGQGKGVSCMGFNDEIHSIFHSTVINPSHRESTYLLDGLNQDEPPVINMHSTDTHGYTEINFAALYFYDILYAPRIKNISKQKLFSFDARSTFKDLGYKILPNERIDPRTIEDEWDNILRFMATIKLKHTSASQLLQRLSHYSRQHPLFRAIKNFGKIIKTIFILQYIDDVELRQAIEKQLNKTESLNKFAKAVFFGNNQEFQQRTKEEQIKADGCKRLIQNAIICWNYLYLSDLIYKTTDPFERSRLIKIIKNGSIVVWGHVNLQGTYDFSDAVLKNSMNFSFPKLVDLDVT